MNEIQINTADAHGNQAGQESSMKVDDGRNDAPTVFIELKLVGDII